MKIESYIDKVINKCDIVLEGCIVSKEEVIKAFASFLEKGFEQEGRTVGMVLHTGSVCFDAILFVIVVVSNLWESEFDTDEFVSMLNPGDIVLKTTDTGAQKKYIFEKMDDNVSGFDGRYLVINDDKGGRIYICEKIWNTIKPYYGETSVLSNKGMRRKNTSVTKFYTQVLELDKERIPNTFDMSTLIIMNRKEADYLVRNIRIQFSNEDSVSLNDLVPISYFTGTDEYRYSGNVSKAEAVIKIASKLSVARNQMAQQSGNKHVGLIICGDDVIKGNSSEIPYFMTRKSFRYVYLCTSIFSNTWKSYAEHDRNIEIFACTKDLLERLPDQQISNNRLISKLVNQIRNIIKCHVVENVVQGGLNWNDYREFKQYMRDIRADYYDSNEKKEFIMQGYSLFNVFMTAVFSMKLVDRLCNDGILNREPIAKQLDELKRLAESMPGNIIDKANVVVGILNRLYTGEFESNKKEEILRRYLQKNNESQILVIVPKAYYADIIAETGMNKFIHGAGKLEVSTYKRIDHNKHYDLTIVTGWINDSDFDVYSCANSAEVNMIIYDGEKKYFELGKRRHYEEENRLNQKNASIFHYDPGVTKYETASGKDIDDVADIKLIDDESEQYIAEQSDQISLNFLKSYSCTGRSTDNIMSDVVSHAMFDDGEQAVFTKNYRAYVIDENKKHVNEVPIEKVNEGDLLLFLKNNEHTHDIVDKILSDKMNSGKASQQMLEYYRLSKSWRDALITYKVVNEMTSRQVAESMKKLGANVVEGTIVNWMDEDSHLVGPMKEESIKQIAELCENQEMYNNASKYYEACRVIRHERGLILKQIGQTIIGRVCDGMEEVKSSEEMDKNIENLSLVLRVDKIKPISEKLSAYLANHPINI